MTHRLITDVLGELHVDARHLVVQQEVTNLAQAVAVRLLPQDGAADPHVAQHADGIGGQVAGLGRRFGRDPFRMLIETGQQASFAQAPGGLKQDRRKGNLLGLGDGIQSGELRL